MTQALTIKNADVWNGKAFERRDLTMTDVILDKPAKNAITVDLSGYSIFPGMINAHDHLELNHYPRTKFRERYDNAHQWGEDVNKRLNDEPFKTLRAYPLEDRLFIGGLKNLLCGATTVMHHNPPHKALFKRDFPVRVLKRYGWAHSLHFNTDEEVIASYLKTPPDVPWFIHIAEGTDEIAAGEYQRLKNLGCLQKNTVFIHGVGLKMEDVLDSGFIYGMDHPKGFMKLVWCPSTNYFLLGESVYGRIIAAHARTALGSDSRLTADGDLLDEMRFAAEISPVKSYHDFVLQSVTITAAQIIRATNTGHLQPSGVADLVVQKTSDEPVNRLCQSSRVDLALIVRGGVPQIGDPDIMARFPHIQTVRAELDGVPKAINIQLARQITKCSLKEPGLELLEHPATRRFPF